MPPLIGDYMAQHRGEFWSHITRHAGRHAIAGLTLLTLGADIVALWSLSKFLGFSGSALIAAQVVAAPLTFWLLYLSYAAFAEMAVARDKAEDELDAIRQRPASNRTELISCLHRYEQALSAQIAAEFTLDHLSHPMAREVFDHSQAMSRDAHEESRSARDEFTQQAEIASTSEDMTGRFDSFIKVVEAPIPFSSQSTQARAAALTVVKDECALLRAWINDRS